MISNANGRVSNRLEWAAAVDTVRAYLTLLKPKITLLLTACGVMAAFIAADHAGIALTAARVWLFVLFGSMASGAAAALNHLFDRDIDRLMRRTAHRPLPSGTLSPREVATFAALLFAIALPAAWLLLGPVVALLFAAGALIYSGLYTLILKRRTPQNIVIGGLAGSCGALAGWAVVDPSIGPGGLLFGLLVFLWTPSHFWGLAIARDRDYRTVGIPMLPQVHGVPYTAAAMTWYAVLTGVSSLALVPFTSLGLVYGTAAAVLAVVNIGLCMQFWRTPTAHGGIRVFKFSGGYLGLLLLAMALDVMIRA